MKNVLGMLLVSALLIGCDGASPADAGRPDGGPLDDAGAATADAGPAGDAGGMPADAGSRDAGPTDAGPADAGFGDAAIPACTGTVVPDLGDRVQFARGLVVARDGTIYFTQIGGVGRLLPDGTLETSWAAFGGGGVLAGLALDAANASLFVSAPDFSGTDAASIYRVDVGSGAVSPIVMGGTPFGLAIGPDGILYFGGGGANHVYRVDPAGGDPTQVTASPVPSARGVAFEAGGTLLVASASPGMIVRITLSPSGIEATREMVAVVSTPDSIALDAAGRIYATSEFGGALFRVGADGSGLETLESGLSSPFALDFGSGVLSTCDLFLVSAGRVARFDIDAPGAATLWH